MLHFLDVAHGHGADTIDHNARCSPYVGAPARYKGIDDSPKLIGPENWNFPDPRVNKAKVVSLLASSPELVETFAPSQARLFWQRGEFGGEFGLISRRDVLDYYLHYEATNLRGLGRCATQVKVWRREDAAVQGLAPMVFSKHLLGNFDTIVSDGHQTDLGRRFWRVQMAANADARTVGILIGNQIEMFDNNVDIAEWIDSINGWGKQEAFKRRRFFISNLSPDTIAAATSP